MHHFINAGLDDANAALAFIDGAFISEELQGMVEDFCSVGGVLDELLRGLVEAVGLEDIGGFEHKVPVDVWA